MAVNFGTLSFFSVALFSIICTQLIYLCLFRKLKVFCKWVLVLLHVHLVPTYWLTASAAPERLRSYFFLLTLVNHPRWFSPLLSLCSNIRGVLTLQLRIFPSSALSVIIFSHASHDSLPLVQSYVKANFNSKGSGCHYYLAFFESVVYLLAARLQPYNMRSSTVSSA